MEIELKNQTEKPFFDRQEYSFDIKDKGTPSHDQLKAVVAKKLNVDAELIVIKRVKHQFGKPNVLVSAYKYSSAEALKKYESVKEEKKAEAEKPTA